MIHRCRRYKHLINLGQFRAFRTKKFEFPSPMSTKYSAASHLLTQAFFRISFKRKKNKLKSKNLFSSLQIMKMPFFSAPERFKAKRTLLWSFALTGIKSSKSLEALHLSWCRDVNNFHRRSKDHKKFRFQKPSTAKR